MPHTGYAGSDDQKAAAAAPSSGNAALAAAGAAGGTDYLKQLYANSQANSSTQWGVGPNGTVGATTNPATQAGDVITAGQGTNIAQSNLTMSQLLQEIGLVGSSTAEQSQYNTQQEGYGLTGLGLTQGQNTLNQQGNAAQSQLAQQQQAIEQGQYGIQSTQYPEQFGEAALANKNAVQALSSQGAISGTLDTQGHKQAVATQAANYGYTQEDIARQQQLAQLGQQSEQAGYQYSAGDIARSEQGLQLAAAQNGLSAEQLEAQFAQGQNQLGTGAAASLSQLYTQYLAAQGGAIQSTGTAAGEEQLLAPTPGGITNMGMNGGINLSSIFNGNL